MKFDWKLISAVAFNCCLIAGCADDDEEEFDEGEFGYVGDEATWANTDASVNYAFADPMDGFSCFSIDDDIAAQAVIPTPNELAAKSAAGAGRYFSPSSCVTASSAGPVATVVLNQCTGPLGTRNFSGTFTATFGQASNGFSMDVAATGVTMAGRTGSWNVNGDAVRKAGGWTLTVSSTGQLMGLNGRSFSRNAQATINWVSGSGCVTVDGQGSSVVNGVNYATQLSGYQRCTGACPAAGTMSLDGPNQDVTVTFDGTSTPGLTSTSGASTEMQLDCGS